LLFVGINVSADCVSRATSRRELQYRASRNVCEGRTAFASASR